MVLIGVRQFPKNSTIYHGLAIAIHRRYIQLKYRSNFGDKSGLSQSQAYAVSPHCSSCSYLKLSRPSRTFTLTIPTVIKPNIYISNPITNHFYREKTAESWKKFWQPSVYNWVEFASWHITDRLQPNFDCLEVSLIWETMIYLRRRI